ncbi:variable surface lipoprotein [Mycoplasma enhydrae]|uniref:variable surface lipoprotein n=1 Tax=Mycoplasma enhydrae TaxID=2499220 RepID=UPI00197C8DB3|nr:variable surface lipoprotein [Mycoplasma enhydrae]MBN4089706.1 hypothetical protein [Mycoplasma enhydrae]
MKAKKLLTILSPIAASVATMPLVAASCDWLYDKPNRPNIKKPEINIPKKPEVDKNLRFDKNLIYDCPKPLATSEYWPGPHQFWHYFINIHKLKVLDAYGNETSQYESNDKKIERYNEAVVAIKNFYDSTDKHRKWQDSWFDLKTESLKNWLKELRQKYGVWTNERFAENYIANYQFFTESRLKDNDNDLLTLTSDELKEVRLQNAAALLLWITFESYYKIEFQIFWMSQSTKIITDFFTYMLQNVNDSTKTFQEQLQNMPAKLKQDLKWLIETLLIKNMLTSIKTGFEVEGKLYAFPEPIYDQFYDLAGQYNKIVDLVNDFYNPLAYLMGFNTDSNDYFFDNNARAFVWTRKYFQGKTEYSSNPKGHKIKALKRHNLNSSVEALEKWMQENNDSLKLEFKSII